MDGDLARATRLRKGEAQGRVEPLEVVADATPARALEHARAQRLLQLREVGATGTSQLVRREVAAEPVELGLARGFGAVELERLEDPRRTELDQQLLGEALVGGVARPGPRTAAEPSQQRRPGLARVAEREQELGDLLGRQPSRHAHRVELERGQALAQLRGRGREPALALRSSLEVLSLRQRSLLGVVVDAAGGEPVDQAIGLGERGVVPGPRSIPAQGLAVMQRDRVERRPGLVDEAQDHVAHAHAVGPGTRDQPHDLAQLGELGSLELEQGPRRFGVERVHRMLGQARPRGPTKERVEGSIVGRARARIGHAARIPSPA